MGAQKLVKGRELIFLSIGIWYIKNTLQKATELTNNHNDDAESVENAGQIPYINIMVIFYF